LTGFRILAVDDDRTVLDAVVELLHTDGHAVETASCAEEAEALLCERFFDLVITDQVMPGQSGLDLIRVVQERDLGTPVLLVTGQAFLTTAAEALGAGAVDYLIKPIDPQHLRAVVNRVLRSAQESAGDPPAYISPPGVDQLLQVSDSQGMIQIFIGTRMKEIERTVIACTLDALGWNKNKTAKVLGISRRSLYNKLARYHIVRPDRSGPGFGEGTGGEGIPAAFSRW